MAQQTAVQLLLLKSVDLEIGKYLPSDVLNELQKAYFEAKEMEKHQKIGLLKWMNKVASEEPMRLETDFDDIVEQYYTETYGNNTKN
jgi:hypothetical protein